MDGRKNQELIEIVSKSNDRTQKLENKIQELETTIETKNFEIQNLKSNNVDLITNVKKLETKLHEKFIENNHEIDTIHSEYVNYIAWLQRRTRNMNVVVCSRHQESINELQEEIERWKLKVEDLNLTKARLEYDMKNLQDENDELYREWEKLKPKKREVSDEMKSYGEKFSMLLKRTEKLEEASLTRTDAYRQIKEFHSEIYWGNKQIVMEKSQDKILMVCPECHDKFMIEKRLKYSISNVRQEVYNIASYKNHVEDVHA